MSNGPDEFAQTYRTMVLAGVPLEGSAAELRIVHILEQAANELGFSTERYNVSDSDHFHSFSQSLRVTLPGESKQAISLIIPLDRPNTPTDISYDPWLNPALALYLLQKLAVAPRPFTIICEFLGAESGQDLNGLGSRRLVQEPGIRERLFNVYLNLSKNHQILRVPQGYGGRLTPAWLLDATLTQLESSGIVVSARTTASQLHRLGLGSPNQLGTYLQASLPTTEICAQQDSPVLASETGNPALIKAVVQLLTANVPSMVVNGPPSWDGNYLVFQYFDRHLVITERSIVLVYLSCLVLLLAVIYFRRGIRHHYVRGFVGQIGKFFLIVAVIWLAFFVSSLIVSIFFPRYYEMASYQRIMPLLLGVRMSLALSFLLTASHFLRRFTRGNSVFYGAAAFIWGLSLLVAISLFNLTLSVYVLGATVAISLANLSAQRWLKVILTLLSGMTLMVPLFESLSQAPGEQIGEYLLTNPWLSSTILLCVNLPFIMLACRQWSLSPLRRSSFRLFRKAVVIGLFSGTLICLFATAIVVNRAVDTESVITLKRLPASDSEPDRLVVEGSGPIPAGILELGSEPITVAGSSQKQIIPLTSGSGQTLKTDTLIRRFLGRKVISIEVAPLNGVQSLAGGFTSHAPVVVHALNFPYQFRDATNLTIFIGKNPVLPLTIEMTVPVDLSGVMWIEAELNEPVVFRKFGGSIQELACQTRLQANILVP